MKKLILLLLVLFSVSACQSDDNWAQENGYVNYNIFTGYSEN